MKFKKDNTTEEDRINMRAASKLAADGKWEDAIESVKNNTKYNRVVYIDSYEVFMDYADPLVSMNTIEELANKKKVSIYAINEDSVITTATGNLAANMFLCVKQYERETRSDKNNEYYDLENHITKNACNKKLTNKGQIKRFNELAFSLHKVALFS